MPARSRARRSLDPIINRRDVLRAGFGGLGLVLVGPTLYGCGGENGLARARVSNIANLGPLGEPDDNGVRLPAGFTSRIVAHTRQKPVPEKDFLWHLAPDGGATFATPDGGWVYVCNSEMPVVGGVGALRFDAAANVIDAYRLLSDTTGNCAGGPTPWGTWLSCEEHTQGQVWECDPFGIIPSAVRPALGRFQHEAVTVDTLHNHLFLTEDVPDGNFYRFRPDRLTDGGFPDLGSGTLEVAEVLGGDVGGVRWHAVSNPSPTVSDVQTRNQVAGAKRFNGGEGIWFQAGVVYFSTKGDNRVWAYDTEAEDLSILYDDNNYESPILRGVDNIVMTDGGDVLVAEDGDDMQLVALTPAGSVVPVIQVIGHNGSEITGPAFDPSGQRLYFNSQRGIRNNPADGMTFEVTGPFYVD